MSSQTDHEREIGIRSGCRRFKRSLRDVGLVYTLQLTTKNVFPTWFLRWGSCILVEGSWRNWTGREESHEGIRKVRPEDAAQFAATNDLALPLEKLLERGAKVSISEADGRITGYFVYDTANVELYDWLLFDLSENVLWNTEAWVVASERGKGLHARIRSFNILTLKGEGYERVLAIIDAYNVSSLRASLKPGQIACVITYFRLFYFTLVWVDGRLRVGFWHPGHRLVVHTDELHSEPEQKFGCYKAKKLERYLYKKR